MLFDGIFTWVQSDCTVPWIVLHGYLIERLSAAEIKVHQKFGTMNYGYPGVCCEMCAQFWESEHPVAHFVRTTVSNQNRRVVC